MKIASPMQTLLLVVLFAASSAQAVKRPQPLLTDARVKQVAYDASQVYELTAHYGYQTAIEFGADENIVTVALGDSIAWQTVPAGNRLFLKPVEPQAKTNLTVITDQRTYFFNLDSSARQSGQTFLLRFRYPESPFLQTPVTPARPASDDEARFDPLTLHMTYAISGDAQTFALKKVFDDGRFTYFLFGEQAEIPAVYQVGADGTEALVNTRREGRYWVAEQTGERFTLRNGTAWLCIKRLAEAQS